MNRSEYYQKNKTIILEKYHTYRIKNRDKINAQKREYYKNNKDLHFKRANGYQKRLRYEVFQHYSPNLCCQYCGIIGLDFLTIDHIDGRLVHGHTHRVRGGVLYGWLKKNHYPVGFQVLCWNCNSVKGMYGLDKLKALLSNVCLNKSMITPIQ